MAGKSLSRYYDNVIVDTRTNTAINRGIDVAMDQRTKTRNAERFDGTVDQRNDNKKGGRKDVTMDTRTEKPRNSRKDETVDTRSNTARTDRKDETVDTRSNTARTGRKDETVDTRSNTARTGRKDETVDTRSNTARTDRKVETVDTRIDKPRNGRKDETVDTRTDKPRNGRKDETVDTRIDKPRNGRKDDTVDTRSDKPRTGRKDETVDTRTNTARTGRKDETVDTSTAIARTGRKDMTHDQCIDTRRVGRKDYPSATDHPYSESHVKGDRDDYHDFNRRRRDVNYHESFSSRNGCEGSSEWNGDTKTNTRQQRNSLEKESEHVRSHSNDTRRYNDYTDRHVSVGEYNLQKSSSSVHCGNKKDYQSTNDKVSHRPELQDTHFSTDRNRCSQRPHKEDRSDHTEKRLEKIDVNEVKNSQERSRQMFSASDYGLRDERREQEAHPVEPLGAQRNRNHNSRERYQRRGSNMDSSCEQPTTRRRSRSTSRNWENRDESYSGTDPSLSQRKEDRRYGVDGETSHNKSHSEARSYSKQNLTESVYREADPRYPLEISTSHSRHSSNQRQSSAQSDSQRRSSSKLELAETIHKNHVQSSTLVSDRSKHLTNYSSKETCIRYSTPQRGEKQTLESFETVPRHRDKSSHNVNEDHRVNETTLGNVTHQNMVPGNRRGSYHDEQDGFSSSSYKQNVGIDRCYSQSNMDDSFATSSYAPHRRHNHHSVSSAYISPPLPVNHKSSRSEKEDFKRHRKSSMRVNSQPDVSGALLSKEQSLSSSGTCNSGGIVNCSFEETLNDNVPVVNESTHNVDEQRKEMAHCRSDAKVAPNCHDFKNDLRDKSLTCPKLSEEAVKENLVLSKSTNGSSFGLAKDKDSSRTSPKGNILEMDNSTFVPKGSNDKPKSLISDSISYLFGKSNKDQHIQSNQGAETNDMFSFSERWRKLKQGIIPETDSSISDPGKDTAAALLQSAATKLVNSFNSFTGMQITLPKSASSSSTPSAKNIATNISTCHIPPNESISCIAKTEDSAPSRIKSNPSVASKAEINASVDIKADKAPSTNMSTEFPPDTFSGRPSTISTNGNLSTHNKRINAYARMAEKVDSPDSEKSGQMTPPKLGSEMKRRSKEVDTELTSFLPAEMSRREERFHEAARVNDAIALRQLLKERVNVDCRNSLDRTALHWATANGNLDATEALIEGGADVDAKDKYGMRSVLWAAWFGHISVLKALVNAGANTRVTNKQGLGMLHCASENNHLAVISFVFEALEPHDVNQKDKNDRTPLHLAAEGGHVEAVSRLLEAKADLHKKDKGGMTAVHLAAKHDHIEVLKALLLQGVEVDDRDVDGKTALHLAAESGHKDAVDLLLDYTANPNSETVKEATPLHLAAQEGHIDVCRSLVKYGSNVNAQNFQGSTALHIAANGDHKEVARILIDVKCELDLPNSRMLTPLHVAIESGHLEVVQVLLAGGASLDTREKSGKSALQLAARGNYVAVVDMLIKAERYYANAREYHDKDVGYVDPDTYLRNPQHPKAAQMKDVMGKLAMKQLKPADWKKLAFHWHFTPEHVKAIEQEYTGTTSYREHGYRLLDIWLHGVRKDENVLKLLTEALVAIDRKQLADQG